MREHRRCFWVMGLLTAACALVSCGSDPAATADAATMTDGPAVLDVADGPPTGAADVRASTRDSEPASWLPACAFTPGMAPAATATTFSCATTAAPPPWPSCPALFPRGRAELSLLCTRPFPTGEDGAAPVVRPEVVLGGTCGGQQVVVLEVLPGRGLECHYDVTSGALIGVAFFAEARIYCRGTASAAAAGHVASAPCLLDMEASWETTTCDEVPTPVCADAGVD